MTEEIKDEALEQLDKDIKFGFETKEELFESIREMFYDVNDFDEEWFRKEIVEKFTQHQKDSLSWKTPTDFQRLSKSFDELIKKGIVCLHKAGNTKSDGVDDSCETIEELEKLGIKVKGFCYYHSQDLEGAIDPEIRNLYIGFGTYVKDEKTALEIANTIIKTLKRNNFSVSWTGTLDQRIEIKDINWKKVPDIEDRGMQRVISILTDQENNKKSFWKLW